jgi:hypothetical protein
MTRTLVPAGLAGTGQSIYAFGSGCLAAVFTLLSGILYVGLEERHFFRWPFCLSSHCRLRGFILLTSGIVMWSFPE